ncbi:MAG: DUF1275 family protein [Burkholderiales bacterium]
MTAASPPPPHLSTLSVLLLALAAAAGYVDAVGFLLFGHIFVASMTGKSVLLRHRRSEGHSDATLRSVLAAGFRRRRGNRDGTAERCGAQTCGAGNLHGRANQYTDFFGRARSSPRPPWQMGPAQAERPTKGLGILFGVWLAYAASPGGARLARRAGGVARVAPRRDGEPWRVGMRPGCRGSGRSGWGSRCDLLPRCSSFL